MKRASMQVKHSTISLKVVNSEDIPCIWFDKHFQNLHFKNLFSDLNILEIAMVHQMEKCSV